MVGLNDLPFRCELSMSSGHPDISIEDLLTVEAQFDYEAGQYLRLTFTQTPVVIYGVLGVACRSDICIQQ